MNEENNADSALYMAELTVALADVMALLCHELAVQNAPIATRLANFLEKSSDDPNLEVTTAYSHIAPVFAQHLRGNMDMGLLSLKHRDPSTSGRSELQSLLAKIRK